MDVPTSTDQSKRNFQYSYTKFCILMPAMPIRVLHVSPFFAPAWVYGGLVESAYQFARHLARAGAAVRVLTTDANGSGRKLDSAEKAPYALGQGFEVRYCGRLARQSVSLELLGALAEQVRWADVVHLHAAYSFPTIPTLLAARMLERPVVWTPHGALQRWSGSRRVRFKSLWEEVCNLVAPRGLVLHLTSESEVEETRARFPRATIELIPNGVEIPQSLHREPRGARLRLGFVGRLDPKKGIENLLAACRMLKERSGPVFSLAIAGSGSSDYEAKLRREIDHLDLSNEVVLAWRPARRGKTADVRADRRRRGAVVHREFRDSRSRSACAGRRRDCEHRYSVERSRADRLRAVGRQRSREAGRRDQHNKLDARRRDGRARTGLDGGKLFVGQMRAGNAGALQGPAGAARRSGCSPRRISGNSIWFSA